MFRLPQEQSVACDIDTAQFDIPVPGKDKELYSRFEPLLVHTDTLFILLLWSLTQEDVSVNRAFANRSGVATLGPIDFKQAYRRAAVVFVWGRSERHICDFHSECREGSKFHSN